MAHSAPPLIPEETEEVRSRRTPPPQNTEGEADAAMAEVNTSVTEDQEGASLLADTGKESEPSGPPPSTTPEPLRPSTAQAPPKGEGAGADVSVEHLDTGGGWLPRRAGGAGEQLRHC